MMYKLLTVFLPCVLALSACAAETTRTDQPTGNTRVRVTVSWEADECGREAGYHFYDTTLDVHFKAEQDCAVETQGEYGTLRVVRQCNPESARIERTYEHWSYATGSLTYTHVENGKACACAVFVSLETI